MSPEIDQNTRNEIKEGISRLLECQKFVRVGRRIVFESTMFIHKEIALACGIKADSTGIVIVDDAGQMKYFPKDANHPDGVIVIFERTSSCQLTGNSYIERHNERDNTAKIVRETTGIPTSADYDE